MPKLFLCLLTFLCLGAEAQLPSEQELHLTITDPQNGPLENATVQLFRASDSSLVKTTVSAKTGEAVFYRLRPGKYYLNVTSVGRAMEPIEPITISESEVKTDAKVVLRPVEKNSLAGVTVVAQKPFIQRLPDRFIVNVDNSSINAGSHALEILDRSPGVFVDGDAISVRGRSGVVIMIDGKISPLSGTDLTNYLRSLPAGTIDRIEIITNPSAKYDAAGNAGIIDIRLKRDQRLGTNGTIQAGFGMGNYPKGNAGLGLNHRTKKFNLFANYNYYNRKDQSNLYQDRRFYTDGVLTASDHKNNLGVGRPRGYTVRGGADFYLTKQTVLGFVVNTNTGRSRFRSNNNSQLYNKSFQPVQSFTTQNISNNKNENYVANVNLRHRLKESGEWNVDVDYGRFNSQNLGSLSTFYSSGSPAPSVINSQQEGKLILRTAKTDYTRSLSKTTKLEAGFKASFVSADNDARFYNMNGTSAELDKRRTNHFFYDEYNYAGYLSLAKDWKKWKAQGGLRAEQTVIDTRQAVGDVRWDSSYLQLFPSLFISYEGKPGQVAAVSVSRRIDRPAYFQLNPFLSYIDITAYTTGNPQLLPQLTWSYEVSYTAKNQTLSLSYSHTSDPQYPVIGKVLDVIPGFVIPPGGDSNITVQKYLNLNALDFYSLSLSSPLKVRSWWNVTNNVILFYNHVKANVGGVQLDNGDPTLLIRSSSSFTLGKNWSADLGGGLLTGRRSGYLVSKTRWNLDAGVQAKILKGQGTLRMNITDMFLTNIPRAKIRYEGRFEEDWFAHRDTRVLNISLLYRFGNNKVEAARRRNTASEEERRRAG